MKRLAICGVIFMFIVQKSGTGETGESIDVLMGEQRCLLQFFKFWSFSCKPSRRYHHEVSQSHKDQEHCRKLGGC